MAAAAAFSAVGLLLQPVIAALFAIISALGYWGVFNLPGNIWRWWLTDATILHLAGEMLVEAVDTLIECSLASFREEEALMARLGGSPDSAHCRQHETVIDRLRALRAEASGLDRSSLLARLILIDRELIAHVATAAQFRWQKVAKRPESIPLREVGLSAKGQPEK